MDTPTLIRNIPEDFDRFIAAPPHRLFGVFDDPDRGAVAIGRLRAEVGLSEEDDIWVFFGDEGARRLDLTGARHGLHAEILRFAQRVMSADADYLRNLEWALHAGALVVGVKVSGDDLDQVASILHGAGGHSLARVAHWNFVPVGA